MQKVFSENARRLLRKRGIRPSVLAKAVGGHRSYGTMLLKEGRLIPLKHAAAIADLVGVPLLDLLTDESAGDLQRHSERATTGPPINTEGGHGAPQTETDEMADVLQKLILEQAAKSRALEDRIRALELIIEGIGTAAGRARREDPAAPPETSRRGRRD